MRLLDAGLIFAPALLLAVSAQPLQPQARKPLLSEAIRTALEKEGPEAAKRRYQEIVREHRDDFEFDLKGLGDLATAYAQAGDMKKLEVLVEITSEVAMLTAGVPAATATNPPPAADANPRPRRDARVPMDVQVRRQGLELLGPGRDDLDRFTGVYGDPAAQGGRTTPHNFFVMASCEGHVRFGAMWGDVAPWSLKSMADAEFAQPRFGEGQLAALRVVFHLEGRRAAALTHNMAEAWGGSGSPTARLERLGDLPAEWVINCGG